MALWQYDLNVISLKSIEAIYGNVPKNIDISQSQNLFFDLPDISVLDNLTRFLTNNPSSTTDYYSWGDIDSNFIDMCTDLRYPYLRIRYDLRNIDEGFICDSIAFVQKYGYIFIDDSGKIITPELCEFVQALKNSDSARFVKEPERIFSQKHVK